MGVTRLCSIAKMYDDLKWDKLEERRRHHTLILFYKMKNYLTPTFLTELVPQHVTYYTPYNLRNAHDYHPVPTRTSLYRNSFLPSAIREWNNLPLTTKNSESIEIFKTRIKPRHQISAYLNYGDRNSQVLLSRLRLKCSTLNDDLFKRSLVESPSCQCGLPETTYHFFFSCPLYTEARLMHLSDLPCLHVSTLNNFLFGSSDISAQQNELLFEKVSKYVRSTKRFAHS